MVFTGNEQIEGFVGAVGSATRTEISHLFTEGSAHLVRGLTIELAGVTADTAIEIYDGVSGTGTLIAGPIGVSAVPDEGIRFDKQYGTRRGLEFTTGSISVGIEGNEAASKALATQLEYMY